MFHGRAEQQYCRANSLRQGLALPLPTPLPRPAPRRKIPPVQLMLMQQEVLITKLTQIDRQNRSCRRADLLAAAVRAQGGIDCISYCSLHSKAAIRGASHPTNS